MKNCEEYAPLSKKINVLRSTAAMFDRFIELSETAPLDELFDTVVNESGYMKYLETLDNSESKIENVQELRSTIVSFMNDNDEPDLGDYLEEIALYTEADRDDGGDDRVTLMTIHSAKGLEFSNVFVVGLEDGIFPSSRSFDSEDDLEEERRLAYVAVTRAKKKLYLTSASQRVLFGQTQRNITSRFIKEIGMDLITKHDNAAVMKYSEKSDSGVTAVHSATLQQQLTRNKMLSGMNKSANIEYSVGEVVIHNIFGEGTIISVKKMANDSMLEIVFDKAGTKKIMANFAKLKKLN